MTPPLVARKTVTRIQDGSRYKESYLLPYAPPAGSTVRQIFLDSSGAQIGEEISGEIDGRRVNFQLPYSDVADVPNGAGFYCYVQEPTADGEDLVTYGTVFRRELVFPNSPANTPSTVVRTFEDDFQRVGGPVGGRWKTLVGQARIFDNTEWFGLGQDHPNTVGPNNNFLARYFIRYYQPFNDDSVELSVSATKKGDGKTIVALCCNSAATSFLYVGFNGWNNTCDLGFGTSPDIGVLGSNNGALEIQTPQVPLTVPGNNGLGTYKIRYDDVTRKLSLMTANYADIVTWTDTEAQVPHGKGYRSFGIGGNASFFDSGVQLAYIKAQGIV